MDSRRRLRSAPVRMNWKLPPLWVAFVVFMGLVPAAASGQDVVTNTAGALYETLAGIDSVQSDSAVTTITYPEAVLEKLLIGPPVARIGEEITYTIRYGNTSASVPLRDAALSDTLPDGLEFVSADPAPQVNGRILTWSPGDLAPGSMYEMTVRVRVAADVRDTVQAMNVAVLSGLNSGVMMAQAPEVDLIGLSSAQLSLEKTADLLEVALGETAPYTVTLENTGVVALNALRIHDSLPEGSRYARGSLLGADSIQANGRSLTIFVAGPLAPGASHTVRYATAVVSADQDVIENRAYATAEDGFVRSADVVAWIQLKRGWPMATRAVIGKVWVDLNDDRRQNTGEPGVDGVDIWTDDGEVVRTDVDGRFSLRNLRAGRHGFRLDPATLPLEYRVERLGLAEDLVIRDADGWTSPRVNFRLVPRLGTISEVRVPLAWSFVAKDLCTAIRDSADRANADPFELRRLQPRLVSFDVTAPQLVLSGVTFELAKADLRPGSYAVLDRVASTLADHPDVAIEISGHTDATGSREFNTELAIARANSVRAYLASQGVDPARMTTRGFGPDRPVASNDTPEGRQQNRRVELDVVEAERGEANVEALRDELRDLGLEEIGAARPDLLAQQQAPVDPCAARAQIHYELVLDNEYQAELEGLALRFAPRADSAVVLIGDSVVATTGASRITLPTVPATSRLTVRAWSRGETDSASATLELLNGSTERMRAAVHNPVERVRGIITPSVAIDALPDPASLPAGATVDVQIEPQPLGWPDLVLAKPDGWELEPGSSRLGTMPVDDPAIERNRDGTPMLVWRFDADTPRPLVVTLRPAGAKTATVDSVSVPTLRSDADRDAEKRRAFLSGPGVEFFSPADGVVLAADRLFVGVKGEPRAAVTLFNGDSVLAEATLRIDGVHDFIGVELTRGPHRLRVRMRNSWQQDRWDSLAVHVSGLPASFAPQTERVSLTADGHTTAALRVRVLDKWGVPVTYQPFVTVSAENAIPVNDDANASSVGTQIKTDPAGWIVVRLRPGTQVGKGSLRLSAGEASGTVPVEVLPAIRPLMVNAVGRVGVGAAPDAFGSLTARGRLDERTAVVLSYDSRKLDAGRDFFARTADPLEQAQYPIIGDASQRRIESASRYVFSARIERGFDWVAFGDLTNAGFASGLSLASYRRSLPGAAARITTGPVTWNGFGASTTQSLQQLQIRGAGSSGPYELQARVLPGTDRLVIETRALENPERMLTQQTLIRYVDYQIDYERGTVLFKRPIPASDTYGNPLFIVVTFEGESGGPSHEVFGLRSSLDAGSLIAGSMFDSLRVGATWVRDGRPGGAFNLAGADLRLLRHAGLDLGAELTYAANPDSSGVAFRLNGSYGFNNDKIRISASWMKIGSEFFNPSNVALRGGTEEIKLGGRMQLGPSRELKISHERQSFSTQGVERQMTTAGVTQAIGSNLQVTANLTADRFENGTAANSSQAGDVRVTWRPVSALDLWTEARQQFSSDPLTPRPSFLGAGAAFRFSEQFSVEARHRQVFLPGDGEDYAVTNLGLRTHIGFGTEAWASYQLAGVDGAHNAAVVGLNNRLRLNSSFTINSMFERRMGVANAAITDPVRALPFLQAEEDYWTAALGLEFLPADKPYRVSARGEYRDGDLRSTRLFTLAGDLSLNRSLALLSRQEFSRTEQEQGGAPRVSRAGSSLWGVAFRPINSDALNVLAKAEWFDATNPIGLSVFTNPGTETRVILATEAIYAPVRWGEIAARYATRRTTALLAHTDGVEQELQNKADFIGWRAHVDAKPWLGFRAEGRVLLERTSGTNRWDLAPQVVFLPLPQLEIASGYRMGDLRDPDFAVNGGHGFFITVGARLTERFVDTAAEFWRERFGGN